MRALPFGALGLRPSGLSQHLRLLMPILAVRVQERASGRIAKLDKFTGESGFRSMISPYIQV